MGDTGLEEEAMTSSGLKGQKEKSLGKTVPLYLLFSFADSWDKILMTIGILGSIGNGLTQPLLAFIFGDLLEAFGNAQGDNIVSLVSKVSLKFVYLALGCGIAAFLQVSCWIVTGERQAARIRALYLKTILQQEIAYFDKEVTTGEVIGRMSGDTILIQDAMGEKVGKFVQVVASFFGGFIIAFIKGWLLTLVLLTSIPLIVISGGIMFLLRSKTVSSAQIAYSNADIVVQQTIGSIRTVASFSGEKQAVAKYKKFLADTYKSGIKEGLYTGLGIGSLMLCMFCCYALAVWFGSKMILHKGYTGGEVFTVLLAVLTGSSSLSQASPCIAAFNTGQAAAFKMFETINRTPKIDAYDTSGKTLSDIHGDIELKDVCFSYPARPTEQIFNEFCLYIPNGTTTALVGQSGSGKSTVISLIERFYDPQAGEVLIDGIDLREFQLKWIRSKIGLVSQEPVLFTASIKENIAYGKNSASLDEIRAAAELANASHFIDKLPEGLDTMVGENGISLSGGQKQRVAIARAIIKDPRILLLDEATSALDADSERTVQEALNKVMINRTTVVVAHRLSTIRHANMIAVVHKGKIIEKGTHFELLQDPQGVYSNLIHSQEINENGEECVDTQNMTAATVKSPYELSQRISSLRSLSSGSQRFRNSFHRSISMSNTGIANDNITSTETSTKKGVPISRLAHLNKPEFPVIIFGVLFAFITGAVLPTFGLLLSSVIEAFYEPRHKMKRDSEFWALMFVVLGVVALLAYPSRACLFGLAGNKLIQRVRLMCFEKLVNMEVGWFDKPENATGVLGSRLSTDAAMIRALVGDTLAQLVQEASSAVVGLIIAFYASWQLALIVLVMIPLVGFNGFVQAKSLKGFSGDAKAMYGDASQIANDAVGNIRTVASFCTQEKILETYERKCKDPVANGAKQGLINGMGFGLSTCLLYLVYAATFYAGARLVQNGSITMTDVFRVFYSLTMVAIAISASSSAAPDTNKANSAATSVFAILDGKSKIDPSDESGMTVENVNGEIKLSHVSFKYPTRPGVQILQNLGLTIHSGKVTALVGESGSGKSTVISLLQRFYDPDSGQITLDGIEIQKFQVKWLRQQMGLVSQEPVLFNQTVRANIAGGKEGNATEEEIIAAAKLANAHEFICGLEQGYDTVVGERGIQLSGGQKQRVAIARAIVKSPKILLLDEATSALDSGSEKIVQEALDRVMLNKTTVVVAHRLSTIKGADSIAVFKNGSVAEKGDHNTLIKIKDAWRLDETLTQNMEEMGIRKEFRMSSGTKEEKEKDAKKTLPFYKLFSFADSWDRVLMAAGTIGAIGNGLAQPLMALLFGDLIGAFGNAVEKNTVSLVSVVSLNFVYLAFGCGTAAFLRKYCKKHVACWTVTGERQAAKIRALYLKSILQQEIAYFDKEVSTGEVIGRMSGDAILFQEAMGEKVGKFIQVVAAFVSGFVIAFAKGWLLTLVLLSLIPMICASAGIMHLLRSKTASQAQYAYTNAATVVQQTVASIRTVASFTGEKQAVDDYRKFLADTYKSGVKEGLYSGLGMGSLMFIVLSYFAFAVWFSAKLILHKGYTGGEVFLIILAVLTGSTNLAHASPCIAAFTASQAAAAKMFETINRKPTIDAYDTNGKILNDIHGDIELRDVCFSYPARPTDQIFNGFSLFIPYGTTAALVGQSGSGKSTVISLIERFYDPLAGEVLVDGIDLRGFQLRWIRSKIGLVSQEPVLFTGSIKENIACGKDAATLDEIRGAAELANASHFIDKLPQGLDTTVGEHGIQLSGGQKQRVAIARAIIKDPKILLLDEATSALDADSERTVQEALDKIMINRTTVIVAHRLSTIRNANMVAVIHQGKIVERGTHFTLLQDPEGVYSNLVHSQEINKDAEPHFDHKNMIETTSKSSCGLSEKIRSQSLGSHGVENISSRSMALSEIQKVDGIVTCSGTSKKSPGVSISRLANLNKPELPVLLLGAILAFISGAILPVLGLLLSSVIGTFYETSHQLRRDSEFWSLMLFSLAVVALVTYPPRNYLFGVAGSKLTYRIRLMCFQKAVNMEIGWFDMPENSTGVICSRLSTDAAMIRALIGDSLAQLVQEASSVAVALVIAFDASWELALIVLVMLPFVGFNGYVQAKSTKGFNADAKILYGEASQVASDAVGNIRTVASFCTQEKVLKIYEEKSKGPVTNMIMQGLINGMGFSSSIFLLYLVYATTFYAGACLVQDGKITMSDVFRVFYSLTMVATSISSTSSLAPDSNKAKNAAASIFSMIDRKSNIDSSDESGVTIENVIGEIEFIHVNFKYPTKPMIQILQNLSLKIRSGKVVALVGESGSGKSTAISLLQRFYDPDSGHITLDGIEIQKFQVKWLRQQMGLVSQEPILFNQTIWVNIACGKEGSVTTEEIVAAAKLANAHEFISASEQGYDTIVGERGIQLSGGQKQRVAIARAILKGPKILLLDEATSALDTKSEKVVQEALDRVMLNRTTVVVAHRLSTIKGADEIDVFKSGSIVEKGNHNTLINVKDGLYASLVRLHATART